jgi:hypothetical protein
MNISDLIVLFTALVALFYTYETHKMRKTVVAQLETSRKAALLSAYATLFQMHIRIVEKDSSEEVARQMPHYRTAILQAGENAEKMRKLVAELEKTS